MEKEFLKQLFMKVDSPSNGCDNMLNKRGYVMVYAIGVIALLMLLGATLTNVTMTRSNWTNKQVYNIQEASLARSQVEAAASELAIYFDDYINVYNKYLYELDAEFETVFIDIQNRYQVIIRDLTTNSCVYPTDPTVEACYPLLPEDPESDKHAYTYAYDIVYVGRNIVSQKRFFLSMIPSFLYFALGSKTDININGGAYIEGDMFVNRNLYLSDTTNYKINNVLYNQPTSFPTMHSTNSLYFSTSQHNLYSCTDSVTLPCFDLSTNIYKKNSDAFMKLTNYFEYTTTFVEEPPKVKTYSDRFLDVNFDASFIYYINDAIEDDNREIDLNNLEIELNTFVSENRLYVANTIEEINNQDIQSVLITNPPVINHDLSFNKKEWIIVNGDLKIENYDNSIPPIMIDANFLVTGKITISGNVQFNSTTYVLGEATIHNANINNMNTASDNQLVLLTKKNIQFSRINESLNTFDGVQIDPMTDEITIRPNIRGFFFSDSYVQVYTVNSYLVIEGGIFSNDSTNLLRDENGELILTDYIPQTDSVGLLINSYRGEVNPISNSNLFNFSYSDYFKKARFVIKHNSGIIQTQPKGLPLNKQLNYLFEDVTVKRK